MDLGIKGKTALVLGASQGLGRAIAMGLAAEGVNIAVVARRAEKLEALKAEAEALGVSVTTHVVDLSDRASVDAFAEVVKDEIKPDIMLSNAGGPPPSMALGVAPEVWRASTETMLFSIITLTEAALVSMRERGWGRIVAIGSSGIVQPIPTLAVSNTVRGAVAGYYKSLSNQIAKDGVTVNMVLPGRVHTERIEQLDAARAEREGTDVASVRDASVGEIPAGRLGKPEEFAAVAVFLMSEQAGYVTGQMTRIDGGAVRGL